MEITSSNLYSLPTTSHSNSQSHHTPSSELSDKMEKIAMMYAIAGSDESKNSDNWILKQLLLDVLFGNSDTSSISPAQQAEMINEIVSSGQPGAIAQAMGINGMANSYSSSGDAVASAPIGGAVSVQA